MAEEAIQTVRLRDATAEDFRAYAGRDPDPRWEIGWFGQVVEREGQLIAIGVVSADHCGRVWVWTDFREPLPAVVVHRNVRRMLGIIREAGIKNLHCYRHEDLDTSEKWLRRLGFSPAPEVATERDKPVWKCTLST